MMAKPFSECILHEDACVRSMQPSYGTGGHRNCTALVVALCMQKPITQ